jgi:hypothetical protein
MADAAATPGELLKAIAKADRICLVEAARPTWIGDRLRACDIRVAGAYGLDLAATWPRLWLIVPDSVRAELGAVREAFSAAARLTAWAVLYLVLGIWWWPALLVAVVTMTAGVIKARYATANLADLVESAVDLYRGDLATQLGDTTPGPLTPAAAARLTSWMRKSRRDPNSPHGD